MVIEFRCENSVILSTNADLVSISNKLYGKAEFRCEKNTRVSSGNLRRYCTPNGWSGKPAYCESQLNFNIAFFFVLFLGLIKKFILNPFFPINQPFKTKTKKAIKCYQPENIENGIILNPSTVYPLNSTLIYECKYGYAMLYGDKLRYCQNSMEWSGVVPTCVPITCGYLARPENCNLVQNGSSLGAIAEYRCHFGYRLKGSVNVVMRRQCTKNSTWDLYDPVCECKM